ncbi:hypothetical protein [Thalassobaculum sp.]|uniref:hypothetical protein n=1 Tax=Thalassobaculum sp. TaxID=2022740 RepID=UPI0032EF2900
MNLRPKTTASPKAREGEVDLDAADGPRAPSGTRGWQAVAAPDGSTTLWRRRGRVARARLDRLANT